MHADIRDDSEVTGRSLNCLVIVSAPWFPEGVWRTPDETIHRIANCMSQVISIDFYQRSSPILSTADHETTDISGMIYTRLSTALIHSFNIIAGLNLIFVDVNFIESGIAPGQSCHSRGMIHYSHGIILIQFGRGTTSDITEAARRVLSHHALVVRLSPPG